MPPSAPSSPSPSSRAPARSGSLRTALATLTAALYLIPATLIHATLAILTSWIPPRGRGMLFFGRVWARGLLASSRVRLEVEMDPAWDVASGGSGGYVFMANHQSYFDIPALLTTVPGEVRLAAKRSLFRIPVFGWALAAGGFIPVDRKDLSQAREVFAAAAARLRSGASVLFFPEGTRCADGRVGRFQRGGFLVALKSGLPIVPVGISGAREVMPRGRLTVSPGTIRVRFGAPVPVEGYGVRGRRALEAEIRRRIVALAECGDALEEPAAVAEA